ncbi:Uncharacterized protein conserved in bacteria [Mycobacteroides abscessus]|uniref:DUF1990 family protein n=1 Tax=Mycobacteroides abscessus TaxID=36809 RepID=UPI0002D98055|nr:DUF1990 domain-containing protein [Mycobacteroides abscessus]CPT30225.1 Uncharacterized protein conserved in bacteria [Mycobacteroides abscessus]CPU33216.1 Uncharacterized protein conserved in bacteria [Mycobacteroides abscessus]SKI44899.1 Uncharacterized protein conserved in bacteria [Mycobacteroides abscessus subsp. massiliense]SKI52013.1 Uncharacterized protein conserved in bacteria [Mycobacteroides abscessus subsp. massiliense]SKJ02072.1 Uncharacterized protein conserved in bacteria [My
MDIARLSQLPFTYPERGATAGELPAGYHHVRESRQIGTGEARFEEAAARLMRFGIQRGIGLRVLTSAPEAGEGVNVATRLWPFWALCRIVYVVDQPNRRGFAYGTLQGHPETGEEAFIVRRDPSNDVVSVEITAFSRPSFWWIRLGNPLAKQLQRIVTQRYLRAL